MSTTDDCGPNALWWLRPGSWPGPQGPPGPPGTQGPSGPIGPQGIPGPVGPQGEEGPEGPAGTSVNIQGELSDPSELPPIGNPGDGWLINGDLWVWSSSTSSWVNAGNIQGPPGPQGPIGPGGATGPQGPVGNTGAQGATGPIGPQGEQGLPGAPGSTGATGPQGPQGVTGPTGPAGADGPAGQGVPAGGTALQVLAKNSAADYDTMWETLPPIPLGQIGAVIFTGVSGNVGATPLAIPGLGTTVALTAGRRYKVACFVQAQQLTGAGQIQISLYVDGVSTQVAARNATVNGDMQTTYFEWRSNALSTGNHTFTIYMATTQNAARVVSAGNAQSFIYVDDIGV